MLIINRRIRIAESELVEAFVRAPGPGGQHVNKAATAVQLRFNIAASPSLPDSVAQRLARLAGKRVNQAGELVIEARRYRSQQRNRADARARLGRWIARAAAPAPTKRKPTRPPRGAIRKAKSQRDKQRRKKSLRRTPPLD